MHIGALNNYHKTEYVTKNVNVTEKRAPTDESIRLLNEMEQKARDNLVSIYSIGNTIFDASAHTFKDCLSNSYRSVLRFKLNNEMFETEFCLSADKYRDDESFREAIFNEVLRQVSTQISLKLLSGKINKFLF